MITVHGPRKRAGSTTSAERTIKNDVSLIGISATEAQVDDANVDASVEDRGEIIEIYPNC